MILNEHVIPELHGGCMGRHGVLPEDEEIMLNVADRVFMLQSDETLFDRELGRRCDDAFFNWSETLNL